MAVQPGSTHVFLNEQGRLILLNDGHRKAACHFALFRRYLDRGVVWIDRWLLYACHYFNPDTKSGLYRLPGADRLCNLLFNRAEALWKRKKQAQAMFCLGAAVHLVQDACVPHHALCIAFNGHSLYENWAEKNRLAYSLKNSGIYKPGTPPAGWVAENAGMSKEYYPLISGFGEECFDLVTSRMLTLAQRTTAGFLLNFYRQSCSV